MLCIVYFIAHEITVTTKQANHRLLLQGGNLTCEMTRCLYIVKALWNSLQNDLGVALVVTHMLFALH